MSLTLAVVPSSIPGDRRAALEALCERLGRMLSTEVAAYLPESYEHLAAALQTDRVQYAWMSPTLTMLTGEHVRLRPLLSSVREDSTTYYGALFVDAARPIRSLEDIRGGTVAWVDPTSASGYLYPRIQLAATGFGPDTLFGHELFLRSHAEVVRAVMDGRADIGATYAVRPADGEPIPRAGFLDVSPVPAVRVLAWSVAIPNDMIVGHGLVPKPEHRNFSNAILTLAEQPTGRRLLFDAFHAERFAIVSAETLQPLRTLMATARAHGLLLRL